MSLTLNDVRSALELPPAAEDVPIQGVSTDTRSIQPGMLFVALRGENFDGHNYVETALAKGALAAVVDHADARNAEKSLVVPNTLTAYGKIASVWRSRFTIPIVAVTGSVGKTTMKEMAALALSPLGPVLKSSKNENNEVGAPQTLLRLNEEHRSAVIEMGMRGSGQIRYLAEVVQPDIGIITMIGESHIELLGSRDAIADAKGELVESLKAGAVAILNADDSYFGHLAAKASGTVRSFGYSETANIRIVESKPSASGWNAVLLIDGQTYPMVVNSPAQHDVVNAAGAVAVAIEAGVTPAAAISWIEEYRPNNMRMEVLESKSGATVLSDCYNAAPSSVLSALSTLATVQKSGKRIAFLGDMRELGDFAQPMHESVASEARRLGLLDFYAIGELMPTAFPDARASFADSENAAQFVLERFKLSADDVVLVKGSRALQLEKVVEALVQL